MHHVFLLISGLLLGTCVCRPTDSEYAEYALDAPTISSSFQEEESGELSEPVDDFVITKRELVVSQDNSPVNLTHQQTFLLADIITRIESSIVHSAFDIVSVFKINKHSDGNNTESLPETTRSSNEPVTLFSESMATTIPSTHDMPAHVSIDKATVYEANSGNVPFIPTFQFASGIQNENKKIETADKNMVRRSVGTTVAPSSSTTVDSKASAALPQSSIQIDVKSEKPAYSTTATTTQRENSPLSKPTTTPLVLAKTSTIVPPTPASTSSEMPMHDLKISKLSTSSTTEAPKSTTIKTTTPKSAVKELKEQEEEAKEKIAEIEAEPVILSSRI